MRSLIFLDLHRLSCFISIHAPTRGATVSPVKSLDINKFQSTLPHGERLRTESVVLKIPVFQSTLPHGERPSSGLDYVLSWYFNPRSRTGSDRAVPDPAPATVHFNPRSRTGSDFTITPPKDQHAISIHAPARGATGQAGGFRRLLPDFNPRSRTGSDFPPGIRCPGRSISIHAPARGATFAGLHHKRRSCNFNPRSRTGSD